MDQLFATLDIEGLAFKTHILEVDEQTKGAKDLFKQFQSKDDYDDDDDDDKKGKKKLKLMGIEVKKSKVRIVRIKSSGVVAKAWPIDDIASISLQDNNMMCIAFAKTYNWMFETVEKRTEFLDTLLKLFKKLSKQLPVLVGFDEELIAEQMEAFRKQQPKELAEAASEDKDLSNPSSLEASLEEEIFPVEKEVLETLPNIDLDLLLSDFDWKVSGDASALEERLITELQALDDSNVHDIIQSEERANAVIEQIESTISELAIIEQWLNKYTKLLESMGQDVHQIEAQNKGIQVVTNNQKALFNEVQMLLQSLKIPAYVIEVLENEPLDMPEGVKECEKAIEKVMDILHLKLEGLSTLLAVKERLEKTQSVANRFASRLHQFLTEFFAQQAEIYLNDKLRASQRNSLKLYAHEQLELKLFKFRKLLVWLKDNDARKHYDLQMSYVTELGRAYLREIGEFLEVLKTQHMARKPAQEDLDFLFFNQNLSISSAATNALKSAIRSGDRGIKAKIDFRGNKKKQLAIEEEQNEGTGMKQSPSLGSVDSALDDRMSPDEALGHALLKLANIMAREQNLLMDIFNLVKRNVVPAKEDENPQENIDLDSPESQRIWQEHLGEPHHVFKDPKAEKRISELLNTLFNIDTLRDTLTSMIDTGLKYDQSFAVGMMVHIEIYIRDYQNTCHLFVTSLYNQLYKQATQIFEKFVIDQCKIIEETRVTAKKRTGVLPFIKTFPKFVDRVEKMLSSWDGTTRKTVDKAYVMIIKSMFETLDACAQQATSEGDEKDSLNIYITTVENMHHFYTEIRARKVPGLEDSVKLAKLSYDLNLESYCNVVIRKPLGKLVDFFEGVEGLLKKGPANEVSFHVQFSKAALRDVIKKYPGKEIKKSLEVLYKRVEKHFPDEDGLLQVVWRGIQEEFTRMLRKYEELIAKCYPESNLRIEFTMEDLLGLFSSMAKAR